MIEVQLVNAIAPFVLCNRLSKLMRRENTGKKTYYKRIRYGRKIP